MARYEIPSEVSKILDTSARAQGFMAKDLCGPAAKTDEMTRLYLNGSAVPDQASLKMLCEFLGLDFEDTEKVALRDRAIRRLIPLKATHLVLGLGIEPINDAWQFLTDVQKDELLLLLKGFLTQNRKATKPSSKGSAKGYTKPVVELKPKKKS